MPRARRCDAGRTFAATATVSFGVLGWLFVQWMTFGIVEHSHLTSSGVVEHHHPYAGPLAVTASAVALASLLAIFVVRLRRRGPEARMGPVRPERLLVPAAMAAGLFVLVECLEFHGAGLLHEPSAFGILVFGAILELLLLPLFWTLGGNAALAVEQAALGLAGRRTGRPWKAGPVLVAAASWRRLVRTSSWNGRAPPVAVHVLLCPITPVPATPIR